MAENLDGQAQQETKSLPNGKFRWEVMNINTNDAVDRVNRAHILYLDIQPDGNSIVSFPVFEMWCLLDETGQILRQTATVLAKNTDDNVFMLNVLSDSETTRVWVTNLRDDLPDEFKEFAEAYDIAINVDLDLINSYSSIDFADLQEQISEQVDGSEEVEMLELRFIDSGGIGGV